MKTQTLKSIATTMLALSFATQAFSAELKLAGRHAQAPTKTMTPELAKRSLKETFEASDSKSPARQNLQNLKRGTQSMFEDSNKDSGNQDRRQSLDGTSNGGGGAAYRLPNGQLVTLPEFGILIQDKLEPTFAGKVYERYPTFCELAPEVKQEIESILLKVRKVVPSFSFHRFESQEAIPDKRELVCKFDVNSVDYERIKQEYRQVLQVFGYRWDADKFVLPAISKNGVTYLLPDFNKLNDTQKAKYMIHEAEMRVGHLRTTPAPTRLQVLERALKIDTLIEQLAFPKPGEDLQIFDVLKRLAKLELINQHDIFGHIMWMLVREMPTELPLYSFIEEHQVDRMRITLNPSFIQELQIKYNLKNNYAAMLDGSEIRLTYYYNQNTHPKLANKYCPRGTLLIFAPEPYNTGRPSTEISFIDCKYNKADYAIKRFELEVAGPFIKSIANPK